LGGCIAIGRYIREVQSVFQRYLKISLHVL
jgi:hypothetical protein